MSNRPAALHAAQKQIVSAYLNRGAKYVTVAAGRGLGKDIALYQLIDHELRKGKKIGFFGHQHTDNIKVMNNLLTILPSQFVKPNKSVSNMKIEFRPTGGTIEFKSFRNPLSIKGQNFYDVIFIGEAAFMSDETWNSDVTQVCDFAQKVGLFSSANGMNWFYKQWERGQTDDPDAVSFRFTSYDNPLRSHAELDRKRLELPDHYFRQEYLCEFLKDGTLFNRVEDWFTLEHPVTQNNPVCGEITIGMRWGVDVAVLRDFTVVAGFNNKNELVYYDRFNGILGNELYDRIAAPMIRYGGTGMIDSTGMGFAIADEVGKRYGNLSNFRYLTDTKTELFMNYVTLFNGGEMRFPKGLYDLKMEHYKMKIIFGTRSGNPQYTAPSGYHDDGVNACALAQYIIT